MLLDPLKKLSQSGVLLKDPWGRDRWVRPFLFPYVADEPEIKDSTGVRSVPGDHPCEICMIHIDHLGDPTIRAIERTKAQMKREVQRIMDAKSAEAHMRLCQRHGLHPVKCAFWGFCCLVHD